MKKYSITVAEHPYQVTVKKKDDYASVLEVSCVDYQVEIQPESSLLLKSKIASEYRSIPGATLAVIPSVAHFKNPGRLTVLLLGLITQILMSVGQSVKIGDSVCAMEAMRMENEIKSHTGGTIRSISVKVGDTLQEGSLICEMV